MLAAVSSLPLTIDEPLSPELALVLAVLPARVHH